MGTLPAAGIVNGETCSGDKNVGDHSLAGSEHPVHVELAQGTALLPLGTRAKGMIVAAAYQPQGRTWEAECAPAAASTSIRDRLTEGCQWKTDCTPSCRFPVVQPIGVNDHPALVCVKIPLGAAPKLDSIESLGLKLHETPMRSQNRESIRIKGILVGGALNRACGNYVQVGDTIVSINGRPCPSLKQAQSLFLKDGEISLIIHNSAGNSRFVANIAPRPLEQGSPLGVWLRSGSGSSLTVTRVDNFSPFSNTLLDSGHVCRCINETPCHSFTGHQGAQCLRDVTDAYITIVSEPPRNMAIVLAQYPGTTTDAEALRVNFFRMSHNLLDPPSFAALLKQLRQCRPDESIATVATPAW
jgi:hypothetical protein